MKKCHRLVITKKSALYKPLDDNKINQLKEVIFIIKLPIENENKTLERNFSKNQNLLQVCSV